MSTETNTDLPPSLPDVDTLRDYVRRVVEDGELTPNDPKSDGAWETAPAALLDLVTALGGKTSRLLDFIEAIPSLDLTPPPVEPAPWEQISTDREQPTLARVTWASGRVETRFVFRDDHFLYDASHVENLGQLDRIARVAELLHTHNPETHVPVERALIDEAARYFEDHDHCDHRSPTEITRALAALANGADQ